jgi:hypothetical protein
MTVYDYAFRLEQLIGPCTFPLGEGKKPIPGYRFSKMFQSKVPIHIRWAEMNRNNPMAVTLGKLCCIDFDWHGDHNTVPYFEWLIDNKPEVLDGLYIEGSKNGGIHAVGWQNEYMKTKSRQYDYDVLISGKWLNVEIKIGENRYFATYPTPGYTPITNTLVEMIQSGELKEVHSHWNKDCRDIRRTNKTRCKKVKPNRDANYGDITPASDDEYKQFFINSWVKSYATGKGRHYGAGMLAKQLCASGCDLDLIRTAVTDYWSLMDRAPRKGEIDEAINGASVLGSFEKHSNEWIMDRYKRYRRNVDRSIYKPVYKKSDNVEVL